MSDEEAHLLVYGATDESQASIQAEPLGSHGSSKTLSATEHEGQARRILAWLIRFIPSGTYRALLRQIAPEVDKYVKRSS